MTLPGFFEGTGMPDPGWWEALWPDPAAVIADVGIKPGRAVVDLCCGDGWFTVPMVQAAGHVMAVDLDPALLASARTRLAERGLSNSTFVQADAFDLERFVREPADHVFLANAFHGVPDKPRLARVVHDVLRPRGLFAVVNWHARPRDETRVLGEPRGPATELRLTPAETVSAVEPSGLAHTFTVQVSPFHYAAVFERAA